MTGGRVGIWGSPTLMPNWPVVLPPRPSFKLTVTLHTALGGAEAGAVQVGRCSVVALKLPPQSSAQR
ncbi:hypothetical protein D7X30_16620 [Corallococcus sp. AB011P]|nr:hypothetical protein D7X30_16620 [Corallococcus sp. AB011P]